MRKSMIAGILGGAAVCGGAVGTFAAYQIFNGFLKRNSDIRKDDEPATVIDRLKTYHEKTAPLKDFYAARGKLVTVEGQEEIADTSKLTLAAVKG